MRSDADRLMYLAAGVLAAIVLGMALTPLREATTAANLAFPFLILTIVAAEYGGPWAALATAIVSSMSLDFFLTQPYQTLAIASKHDVITLVGLTACGLLVAAFGSVRGRAIAAMRKDRARLDLLCGLVEDLADGPPAASALNRALNETRAALPLTACLLRNESGEVVAASERAFGLPAPSAELSLDMAGAIPAEGARIALEARRHRSGWLEIWGNGNPADLEARRTLGTVGRIAALMLGG